MWGSTPLVKKLKRNKLLQSAPLPHAHGLIPSSEPPLSLVT